MFKTVIIEQEDIFAYKLIIKKFIEINNTNR